VFLVGGTAFSGKTLLAHLLNQGTVACMDEPDFHDASQRHRGIPVLRELFPGKEFPPPPERSLSHEEAVEFLERCEEVIRPSRLGMKTAGWTFLEYAKIYRARGWPVIALVRDIRDVLAEAPLPPWIDGERGLNNAFRAIWTNRDLCDLLIRYEELVTEPDRVMAKISALLGSRLEPVPTWNGESVHDSMFKLDRHDMLRLGAISPSQVGIWKESARAFSDETMTTAVTMGYGL
jgi:hypothetical protein